MKKFFTTVLASALGTFFAISLSIILIISFAVSTVLFTGEKIKHTLKQPDQKNGPYVLKIELSGNIEERSSIEKQFLNVLEKKNKVHTLMSLTNLLKMAKKNKKIKGIYLKIQNFSATWSVLKQLQKQLIDFKKSEKFIIAFAQGLSEKDYLLASTATKLVLYPEGHIEWNGFHAQFTSFKELLDKAKIELYVFRTGKFKSAVEPLISKTISEENKLQIKNVIDKMWTYLINGISRPNVNKKILNYLAQNYFYLSSKEALKYNLIDAIGTEWKAFAMINEKLQVKNLSSLPRFYNEDTNGFKGFIASINNINTPSQQSKTEECKKLKKKDKNLCVNNQVAILYLSGEIQDGNARRHNIGSLNTVKVLRKIKANKKIKALVIRVNSPGGSALASDIIWSEVEMIKKHIPVVVSIADVAASGGYYLSAGSNFIFAEPSSIIGSIGVFFVRPYTEKLTKSLGIHSQIISTHNNTELFNFSKPLSLLENNRVQKILQKTYNKFKYIIKKGRNLPEEQVAQLATGRYWLGEEAIKLGLVDKIGSLKEAINKAANLAKIKLYSTTNYPKDSYLNLNFALSLQNFLKNTLLKPWNLVFSNLTNSSVLTTPPAYLSNLLKLDRRGILTLMPEKITYK
ncbi:MAG: signal peptide peptidase SppA [Bdellovibrionaceae bacterium]|nr:signal peptide peptidase SppA [Pseudobdellovibrionaceae bacterium]